MKDSNLKTRVEPTAETSDIAYTLRTMDYILYNIRIAANVHCFIKLLCTHVARTCDLKFGHEYKNTSISCCAFIKPLGMPLLST